jgi:uncharacterized membrane protein
MRIARRALIAAAVVWALAVPLSAFAAAYEYGGGPGDLFALAVYAVSGFVCHQRPERSFHLWAVQLPVCARCTGIYAGAAIVLVIASVMSKTSAASRSGRTLSATVRLKMPAIARLVLIAAAAPTVATLAYEWTARDAPGNWVRAAAGLVLGGGVAAVIMEMLSDRVN